MTDDPPKKGLDLSKLLKKKDPSDSRPASEAQSPESPESPQPPSSTEPAKPAALGEKKLDMSKLLSKAKPTTPETPPPVVEKPAQPPVQAKPPIQKPTPQPTKPAAKTLDETLEGPAVGILFGAPAQPPPAKPAAQKPPPPKPQPKPPPPAQAKQPVQDDPSAIASSAARSTTGVVSAQGTTPFKASIENVVSREGAKRLKLDVTVAETRKYPRGFYGVDEMWLHAEIHADVIRRHVWRVLPEHKPGFSIAYKLTGSTFFTCGVVWDGERLTEMTDATPPNPTVSVTTGADPVIDQVRGRTSCMQTYDTDQSVIEGDERLLFWLALTQQFVADEDHMAEMRKMDNERIEARRRARERATDKVECFANLVELAMTKNAQKIVEPLFVRANLPGKVEVLFHCENQKLTVLRGKPGETLLPGALEINVDDVALDALHEGECSLYFLMLANHIQFTGDLNVLLETGLLGNGHAFNLVKFVNKTGKPIGPDNPYEKAPVTTVGPARDPYLQAF